MQMRFDENKAPLNRSFCGDRRTYEKKRAEIRANDIRGKFRQQLTKKFSMLSNASKAAGTSKQST